MNARLIAAPLVLLLAGCGGGGSADIAETPSPVPGGALGTVQLKAMTPSVSEGAGTVNIAVTRTGGSTGAVSVAVATEAGSATAGQDFVATSTTVQFADGDAADKIVAIALMNDGVPEGTETFIGMRASASIASSTGPRSASRRCCKARRTMPGTSVSARTSTARCANAQQAWTS